jgi:predicted DNA-binding transcriptional regulator YafY
VRPAHRLFQIVQLVRSRRLTTAAWLASRLELSERTIYRDIAQLQAQGVPIEGEAGVGYRLRAGFELPPLMFSPAEAKALVACARIAQSRLDPELALAAEHALHKIVGVLPADIRARAESMAVHAAAASLDEATRGRLQTLRQAIEARRKLQFRYRDLQGRESRRTVRPLGCFYWDAVWVLGAWCELRGDFRNFRVDRIEALDVDEQRFRDEPGRTLADLLRAECADEARSRGEAGLTLADRIGADPARAAAAPRGGAQGGVP